MPSDKIVLCTPSFITPDANSTPTGSGGAVLMPARHPKKDGVDFMRAIKTKRQSKINLQLPSLS